MTRKQLKALESLPDVIEALESLAGDAERLRATMARAAGLGILPAAVAEVPRHVKPSLTAATVVSPRPLMIPTPERAEFLAGNPSYDPAAEDEPPYIQRQKAALASLRNDPRREEKLAQFKHDTPEDEAGNG